jgi:hypothetical protein
MSGHHTTAPAKPSKPHPDFPLFPHATGRCAKKIRGKLHYFGPWGDPDGALDRYEAQKEALHAGLTPRPDTRTLTVKSVVTAFLEHKEALLEAGELSPRTYAEYKATTDLLMARFGNGRLVADLVPDETRCEVGFSGVSSERSIPRAVATDNHASSSCRNIWPTSPRSVPLRDHVPQRRGDGRRKPELRTITRNAGDQNATSLGR